MTARCIGAVGMVVGIGLACFAVAPVVSFWAGVVSRAFYMGQTI
jgi:hypothetical protein